MCETVEGCLDSGSADAMAEACQRSPPAAWLESLALCGATASGLLRGGDAALLAQVGVAAERFGLERREVRESVCGWRGWMFFHGADELVTLYVFTDRCGLFCTMGWREVASWVPVAV